MIRKRINFVMIPYIGMLPFAPFRHRHFPGMMPNAIFLSFIFLSWLLFR